MEFIQEIAVSKAVKAATTKKAAGELTPGRYQGSFLARISYDLKRGEDYIQVNKAKAQGLAWQLVAALLEENKTMAKAAGIAGINMSRVVEMAKAMDSELGNKVKSDVQGELDKIDDGIRESFNGKITGTVSVDVLERT